MASDKRSLTLSALLANRLFLAGIALLSLLILLTLAAPVLTHFHILPHPTAQDPQGTDPDGMPLPPSPSHLLGTDNLGRDILSRTLHGARVSLTVGIGAMVTATTVGLLIGLVSGYRSGKTDFALMRITDTSMTISPILLAVAVAGLISQPRTIHPLPDSIPWTGLDFTLERGIGSLLIVIGLVCWPGMVRVIRAQVLAVKEREFVIAARALGASNFRIVSHHILPNILPTIAVLAAMTTANTILLEGGLGYLGVGVPPPAPSWGSMITDGQPYFAIAPHLVIVHGAAIALTVLAFNLVGQGIQEVLDPKKSKGNR